MRIPESLRSNPATSIGLLIGIFLVVILPFGGVAKLAAASETFATSLANSGACRALEWIIHDHDNNCGSQKDIVEMLRSPQWWEAVAYFWTLILTALFLWFDLDRKIDEELKKKDDARKKAGTPSNEEELVEAFKRIRLFGKFSTRAAIIVTLVVMPTSLAIYFVGFWVVPASYITALVAKIILAVTFVVLNLFIISHVRKLKLDKLAEEFIQINRADISALISLAILFFWDWKFALKDYEDIPTFIAGASSAILITTGVLFGMDIIRDASKTDDDGHAGNDVSVNSKKPSGAGK